MPLTDDQIQERADFYGITLEEAQRRYEICQAHGDDPEDPICIGCAKRPIELSSIVMVIAESEEGVGQVTMQQAREYVIREEGTYNRRNGHFLCDDCYIRNGMPSSDRGWVCP